MDWLGYILSCAFKPVSFSDLGAYYLFWITLFMMVNIVWDVATPHTDRFHFSFLKSKTTTAYAAATFSNSFIILLSSVQPEVAKIVGDAIAPLVLAGFIGVLHSISDICPYSPEAIKKVVSNTSSKSE